MLWHPWLRQLSFLPGLFYQRRADNVPYHAQLGILDFNHIACTRDRTIGTFMFTGG